MRQRVLPRGNPPKPLNDIISLSSTSLGGTQEIPPSPNNLTPYC